MKRRSFLGSCAAPSGAATLQSLAGAWANATPRLYTRTRLVDIHGEPIRAGKLASETNDVFHYPAREVPFIRDRKDRSATSGGAAIHCCADHSVYDPAQGARAASEQAARRLAP